tara:strand:- start:1502 stop:2131 length:630 start_codon:yes stop_codon:yes gene_type:complete
MNVNMNRANEVFLGQKHTVARFNLDTRKASWSKTIVGTPSIITTSGNNILVQITHWGRYKHQLLNANNGNEVWSTDKIQCWITPSYYKGDIFFMNEKYNVCKICGQTGEILFNTKFGKWYNRTKFRLVIAENKILLISKKESFEINSISGECIEVPELNNFTKNNITAAYGNGIDQIALFSVIASASGRDAGAAGMAGGDGGGGGGDGG